ncbi:MAG: glycosyltransferase [Clostridia bacterium]|nr:glycosyltransferase [Clostridia bacterium]
MKVLFVNCTDGGSTGKLINSICKYLNSRGDTGIVAYETGSPTNKDDRRYRLGLKYESGIYRRIHYITGMNYGFAPLPTYKLKGLIKKEKPDIVHFHCPNSSSLNLYRLITYLGKHNYPVVVTNHCEMFYTGNCPHSYECKKWVKAGCGNCEHLKSYVGPMKRDNTAKSWKKMYDAFGCCERLSVTSVSGWVYDNSRQSAILGRFPNYIVENGINTNIYKKLSINHNEVKRKYNIDNDKKIVLFVTAQFSTDKYNNKGGYYFVELAKLMYHENIRFILVGSNNSINGLPSNIINIGRVENENELAKIYNIADLSLVLSMRETFSMTTAESLCCGTPAVGFKSWGPESIGIKEYTDFCDFGNVADLASIIKKYLMSEPDREHISMMAQQRYSVDVMVNAYMNVYTELIKLDKNIFK